MDDAEASGLARTGGLALPGPFHGEVRPFHFQLTQVIGQYELAGLFSMDGAGPHHHSVRPRGYDYFLDAVDAFGMEQWRADYRAMAPSQQMMAATIIWLYRGGKDNRWLRRVPCTWSVEEGFRALNAAGAFDDWLRLVVRYPGW